MIHFRREGEYYHIGLNINKSFRSLGFYWVWYDVETKLMSIRGFRIRLHVHPFLVIRPTERWTPVPPRKVHPSATV